MFELLGMKRRRVPAGGLLQGSGAGWVWCVEGKDLSLCSPSRSCKRPKNQNSEEVGQLSARLWRA